MLALTSFYQDFQSIQISVKYSRVSVSHSHNVEQYVTGSLRPGTLQEFNFSSLITNS